MAPVVLVIDDAHWAEPALLDLLLDLVTRLRDAPLLVVWVARPDLLESGGGRVERGTALVLRPLSPTASGSLLAAIAGGRLHPDEERQITEAAGGNPLFLEQLVAYVGEQRAAGSLPPGAPSAARGAPRPARRGGAPPPSRWAIAGDRFNASSVHALAVGVTRADVERACERLVERDLLVRDERRCCASGTA